MRILNLTLIVLLIASCSSHQSAQSEETASGRMDKKKMIILPNLDTLYLASVKNMVSGAQASRFDPYSGYAIPIRDSFFTELTIKNDKEDDLLTDEHIDSDRFEAYRNVQAIHIRLSYKPKDRGDETNFISYICHYLGIREDQLPPLKEVREFVNEYGKVEIGIYNLAGKIYLIDIYPR